MLGDPAGDDHPERREIGLKTLQDLATTPTSADQKAAAKHETKRMGEDPEQLPSVGVGEPGRTRARVGSAGVEDHGSQPPVGDGLP